MNSDAFEWNNTYKICICQDMSIENTYLVASGIFVAVYELSVSMTFLALFLRPIFKLKAYKESSKKMMILKIALLNIIMILSRLVSVACFVLTGGGIWSLLNNIINCTCVILMFKVHH